MLLGGAAFWQTVATLLIVGPDPHRRTAASSTAITRGEHPAPASSTRPTATRDMVDVVLEEAATLPPGVVNNAELFNVYIAEVVRRERRTGRTLNADEKRAILSTLSARY
jgi:hypothetical protein